MSSSDKVKRLFTGGVVATASVKVCPEIQLWPADRLVPYLRNPRKNDAAVDRMVASISEYGLKVPVLARSSGEIVDGHLRLKAAHKLGITEIPVIRCDEWTEAQVKAFRLLVNRSAAWAEWDEALLAVEFQELQAIDFNLALTGFDPGEIQATLAAAEFSGLALSDEDAVPAAPPVPVSQAGDIWIAGPHRIACGDATQWAAVEGLLQGQKADAVFTDPPYNVNYDGRGSAAESGTRARSAKGPRSQQRPRTILNDHLTDEQFLEFCRGLFGSHAPSPEGRSRSLRVLLRQGHAAVPSSLR
jgi:ParB-like chromosome segregation protein Spo0J